MIASQNDERLTSLLSLVDALPPPSPLVRRLLAIIAADTESPSSGEVAGWIEKDALICGKVLALANSALYARTVPILSVRLAVSRLGLNPLFNLILGVSLNRFSMQAPTPAQWSATRFNTHSLATAVLSELIASTVSPENMEVAFLAGLFHDIGRVVIAMLLRDTPDVLEHFAELDHLDLEAAETEMLGFSHSEVSARVVRHWNLPDIIESAVRFHENPSASSGASNGTLLSEIVHFADRYVDTRGFSIQKTPRTELDPELRGADISIALEGSTVLPQFQEELDVLLRIL